MDTGYSKRERTTAEGNAVLFRRKDSSIWQARIRRHVCKWFDISTKESDFNKAKKAAADKFYYMKWLQEYLFWILLTVCNREKSQSKSPSPSVPNWGRTTLETEQATAVNINCSTY